MKKAIVNGRFICSDRIVTDRILVLDGDQIDGFCREIPSDVEIVNAEGEYVAPGFVDIHVHGGNGSDFMDGTKESFKTAALNSLYGGATTIFPTTVCSDDKTLENTFDVFESVKHDSTLPNMPGLHLEGPYFSLAQAGAQNPRTLKLPTKDHVAWLMNFRQSIARVSAACELPGAMELGDILSKNGIVAAIGHSSAEYGDVGEAILHGYRHITHLYSGMELVHRKNAYRVLGTVESSFLSDELTVEIIADGRHLPPELLRMILKLKPHSSISLITDALRGSGLAEGTKFNLGGGDSRYAIIENGVAIMPDHSCFAGSIATASDCIRTIWRETNVPLFEAVNMMTKNPCKAMNIMDRGELMPGKKADIVFFDDDIRIKRILLRGKVIV